MKKIGIMAVAIVALMSCNGGANDGNPNTDTTTFPSEEKLDTSTTGLGGGRDSSDRAPGMNSTPSSSTSRSTTPGNQSGKEDSSTTDKNANNH